MSDKTILEQWRAIAYDQQADRNKLQQFWAKYFNIEKNIYTQLLENPDEVVTGKGIKSSLRKYNQKCSPWLVLMESMTALRFRIRSKDFMDENITVKSFLTYELYKNMVDAKADWLYNLPQWDKIFTPEKRKELYLEQKKSGTVVKAHKIGRNDPCPCGSGKKYKFCCGRNK